MIVRTYGRRNRGIARSYSDSGYDDVSESFRDSLTQESPQDIYSFALSSQDSSRWSFDSEPIGSNSSQESRQLSTLHPRKPLICRNLENGDGDFRKSKKARNGKRELEVSKKMKSKGGRSASVLPAKATATATLMETQEFGEMMEHVDEVNFALDGLRKGQPARIRRASLLSLLSICGTAQQRRLLRTHGRAKTIIDAVLGLSFDDSPTNLAAAALFYFLTSDGQDDHLLDSPRCIHFLIKLLTPLTSGAAKAKAPTIGSKLLSLRKDADTFQDVSKGADSTSAAIMFKVQELLISCKEMKLDNVNDHGMRKPELSPKWFALLTLEKACLSTISLEDTTGTVRKTGGNFKEKLRELGGLDVVFEIARNCHSILEGWLEQSSSSIQESKDNSDLESLVLLLKCLKIMENATFLSKDNQSHLLGMKAKIDHRDSPWSFTKLIISVIKILSGLSLLKNSSGNSQEDDINLSNGMDHVFEMPLLAYNKVDNDEIFSINSSMRCCSQEQASSQKGLSESHDSRWLSAGRSEHSQPSSETTTTYMADSNLLKTRIYSSTSGSCSGTSRGSNSETPASNSRMNFGLGKRPKVPEETRFELIEDSQDPFAFDEDDFKPSKWDLLSGTQKVSHNKKSRAPYRELEDQCQSHLKLSQRELSNSEVHHSREVSSSSAADERKSNLLVECLLAAVKVLMNLTNDNPLGCQQIAACGGLETLASLIANHFPLFGSFLPPVSVLRDNISTFKSSIEVDHQNDRHLSDQELDLLVAILGLLVNLVEKDSSNRSRLASVSVSLRGLEGTEDESRRDVIPLLCSLFLANQGAGEADGEENLLPWDDEAALSLGEKEAEKMIVEAYAALLLAFLSTESKSIRNSIAECLPDHNLAILVPVLERFVEFHMALDMISPETHSAVLEVIESCRLR